MTNGDRIRGMSDKGLAKLLDATTQSCNLHCVARHLCNGTKIGERETCAEMICKWLKQEAEE